MAVQRKNRKDSKAQDPTSSCPIFTTAGSPGVFILYDFYQEQNFLVSLFSNLS